MTARPQIRAWPPSGRLLPGARGDAVYCLGPGGRDLFMVAASPRRAPGRGEIEVEVAAAAVNPIDVHRAQGYGARLLSLRGASRFPLVLGNDFAGTVVAVGPDVKTFREGDAVFGLKPPSSSGTHASHVIARAAHTLHAPRSWSAARLAALPYCFVTMRLALAGAGITSGNARGLRVLVHGAAGGLGTLALHWLAAHGARAAAICRPAQAQSCLAAGATEVIAGGLRSLAGLAPEFEATLNFATWEDDAVLLGALRQNALGHATTTHPLLSHFDARGWFGGGLAALRDYRRHAAKLPPGTKCYAWTVFRPDALALTDLRGYVEGGAEGLAIACELPLRHASAAFDHVRARRGGRAVLTPLD